MAAITLTPVDSTTLPIVVNTDIIYHVFTINGVTRVFFSKGGKSPYQVDVQESAASIAAASPNLVEITTVNGAEYVFIGSGAAGPGLGIMFIEDDGSGGSKITFKYNEESGTTTIYSSDSPSVITARINASSPSSPANLLTKTVDISAAQAATLWTQPVELIAAPPTGYAILVTSATIQLIYGTTDYDFPICYIGNSSGIIGFAQWCVYDTFMNYSANSFCPASLNNSQPVQMIYPNEPVIFYAGGGNPTQGDSAFKIYLNYQYIQA